MIRLAEDWGQQTPAAPPRRMSDLTFALIVGAAALAFAIALAVVWPQ